MRTGRNFRVGRSALSLGAGSLMLTAVLLSASSVFAGIKYISLGNPFPTFTPTQRTALFHGRNQIRFHGTGVNLATKIRFPARHAMISAKIKKRKSKKLSVTVFVPLGTPLGSGRAALHYPVGKSRFNYRIFRRGTVMSIRANRTTADLDDRVRVTFRGMFFGRNTTWNYVPAGNNLRLFKNTRRVGNGTDGRVVFDVTPVVCGRFDISPWMLADAGSPDTPGAIGGVMHTRRGYLGANNRVKFRLTVRAAAGQRCPYRPPPPPPTTSTSCAPGFVFRNGQCVRP